MKIEKIVVDEKEIEYDHMGFENIEMTKTEKEIIEKYFGMKIEDITRGFFEDSVGPDDLVNLIRIGIELESDGHGITYYGHNRRRD